MNRKEEGNYSHNSNQHPNSEMELTNEVKLLNDYTGLSSSVTTNKSDSDVNGDDQNRDNCVRVDEENKSTTSNEMKEEEDEREINSEDNNSLILTPEEIVLAHKILGNHLILRKILTNIPIHQIMGLRLVNKLWEEEGTSIIMNNPPFSIFLKYHPRQRCYYVYNDSSCLFVSSTNGKEQKIKKGKPLSELNSCISSSRRFPCSCFEIINRMDVETEDMNEFLRLHGEEIKIAGFRDMKVASHRLLLEKIPNILKLRISSIGSSLEGRGENNNNREKLLFPTKKSLPHLKSLYFVPYSSQISEIILASPNLQDIERDAFEAVDALVSMKKIHLIQHLNLSPKDFQSLELLQKWADAKPKLTNLSLNKPYRPTTNSNEMPSLNMGKSLTKILWSSRESLKSIYMCLQEEYFNDVLWPSFEGLQVLSIWNERGNLQSFPPNFISNVFSTITKLYIGNPEPSDSINSFLVTDVQLPSLKIVHIQTGYPELLKLLLRAAPNVEELTLHRMTEFFNSIGFIWQFSRLKNLYITSLYGQLFLFNQFPQLDMAISGLSEEIVRRLHKDSAYFEGMKGQEIARVSPSILDCKALETLSLKFDGLGSGVGNKILFTSISGEFGFKLMKHVNVKISCTPECEVAFQPLIPYVELVVEHPRPYSVYRYA